MVECGTTGQSTPSRGYYYIYAPCYNYNKTTTTTGMQSTPLVSTKQQRWPDASRRSQPISHTAPRRQELNTTKELRVSWGYSVVPPGWNPTNPLSYTAPASATTRRHGDRWRHTCGRILPLWWWWGEPRSAGVGGGKMRRLRRRHQADFSGVVCACVKPLVSFMSSQSTAEKPRLFLGGIFRFYRIFSVLGRFLMVLIFL